ncbi:hypothetical protein GCM10007907_15360 [Chitinimonas prasina]|uniref:Uncharacterized protein n=1 Tax=Chitinimonas prasina TaxID=1434937 RepID=A0ABQ5YDY8_9NEIS|nr:hypothetical protein [Chitinimonas prasina]GLR12746.1 hypothetical protein GCM10007907_15360 [Chitinimonas prasina]
MHKPLLKRIAPMIALALSLPSLAAANPAAPGQAPGQRRVPPNEAFAACDGKQEGVKVSFTTPHGDTVSGTCKMIAARLAAIPDHPPRQRPGEPGAAK